LHWIPSAKGKDAPIGLEAAAYRFEFGSQCHDCPHKAACLPSAQPHRTIVLGTYHEALQQRRCEQQSQGFELRIHWRNAIEGTISELVRGHGLRRARYRRFAKVDLQNQFIAVACNIKSWFQKHQGTSFAARKEEAALNVGSLEKVLASFFMQTNSCSF